jgi:hypothetical protein
MALGFPDGAFFGALRAAGDQITWSRSDGTPKTRIRQQWVDTYTPESGDVLSRGGKGLPGSLEFAQGDRCLADGDVFAAV